MSSSGRRSPKRPSGFFSTLMYYLTAPFRHFSGDGSERRRSRSEGSGARVSVGQRFLSTLAIPFVFIGEAIGGFFRGLGEYATSRSGVFLLQGIPAALVFVGTLILGGAAFFKDRDRMLEWYKEEGTAAFSAATQAEDPEKKKTLLDRAIVCFERWAMLAPRDPEPKYDLALASYQYDSDERKMLAFNQMEQLAPINKPGGYKLAHNWLAKYYAEQMSARTDDQRRTIMARDRAETHLMRTLMIDRQNFLAHVQLAQLYFQQRRFDKAETHLLIAVQQLPDAYADLATLYKATGQKEKATQYATMARDHFLAELERDGDRIETRAKLAQQYLLLGDNQKCLDTLLEGIKLTQDYKKYGKVIANVFLEMMAQVPDDDWEQKMLLYDRIIEFDPGNEAAFNYLVRGLGAANPLRNQIQERIDKFFLNNNSAVGHWMLSSIYLQQEKYDLASKHLRMALEIQPQMMPALNNLAYIMILQNPPEYQKALEYANKCLQVANEMGMREGVGVFLDTRGQIYLRMRRFNEAIKDLELAVSQGMGQNLKTREALVKAYQEIGKTDLAVEEARIVELLRKQQKPEGQP